MNQDDKLNSFVSRMYLEFLNSQKNVEKMPPYFMYQVTQKVIIEVKMRESDSVYSDRYRVDNCLSEFLSKMPQDIIVLSPMFFDTLKLSASYMNEIPSFFPKAIRHVFSNEKF